MEIDDELREQLELIFGDSLGAEGVSLGLAEMLATEMLDSIAGATREEILRAASDTANLLAQNMTNGQLQVLADTLEGGLRDQIGIPGLQREIREVIDLTPAQAERWRKERAALEAAGTDPTTIDRVLDGLRNDMINQRAEVIAQAEARNAVETGELAVATNRGDTHKFWITVGDDRVTDECQANESEGPIPIEGKFASGDSHPPRSGNPRCRCTLGYVKDTGRGELGRAEGRAEDRAQKTQSAKA